VQHLMSFGPPAARDAVAAAVAAGLSEFATHKFASNVAERALVKGSEAGRAQIVGALIASPLMALARDRFGNYVVQRGLELSAGAQRAELLALLSDPGLKKVVYGKHIASAVEQIAQSL